MTNLLAGHRVPLAWASLCVLLGAGRALGDAVDWFGPVRDVRLVHPPDDLTWGYQWGIGKGLLWARLDPPVDSIAKYSVLAAISAQARELAQVRLPFSPLSKAGPAWAGRLVVVGCGVADTPGSFATVVDGYRRWDVLLTPAEGLAAVEGRTAQMAWRRDVPGGVWEVACPSGGPIYACGPQGLWSLDPQSGDCRQALGCAGQPSRLIADPATPRTLLWVTPQALYCLEARAGAVQWVDKLPPNDGFDVLAPVVAPGPRSVTTLARSGRLRRLDLRTGLVLWEGEAHGGTAVYEVRNHLLVERWPARHLVAYAPSNGRVLWQVSGPDLGVEHVHLCALTRTEAYVALTDHTSRRLARLDLPTGCLLWSRLAGTAEDALCCAPGPRVLWYTCGTFLRGVAIEDGRLFGGVRVRDDEGRHRQLTQVEAADTWVVAEAEGRFVMFRLLCGPSAGRHEGGFAAPWPGATRLRIGGHHT